MTDPSTQPVSIATELADWLAHMRRFHEQSLAVNDPVIQDHIAKLKKWEAMVRSLAVTRPTSGGAA